jgi:hypothetical protein
LITPALPAPKPVRSTPGDIVGLYVSADKATHGLLLSGNQFSTIDFPGATVSFLNGINPQGDIAGAYDGQLIC